MVRNRTHDTHPDNSLHADGFDDFRAGSLAQDVVMRERLEAQDVYKRQILEQLTARQFAENMAGIHDKPGIGLGTLISGLMTAAGHPPTSEQAKMLMALDGGTAAASSNESQPYSYAASAVDLDSLFGAGQGKAGITMPRAEFGGGLKGLLNTIAHFETNRADLHGNEGYDRVYGAGIKTVPLTQMSIKQVLAWQDDYVADGSKSSAAGRYQIIRGTLRGLVSDMDLTGNELFDAKMQDAIALTLLKQAGLDRYMNGRMGADDFRDRTANIWASVQNSTGTGSYDHDGLNKAAHGSGDIMLASIRNLAPAPSFN